MKSLQAFLALFALSTLPAFAELVQDPKTFLWTGTITINGQTYPIEYGADLSGADLSGAELHVVDLRSANLTGANLTGAELYSADFTHADLTGANLSDAELHGADLRAANLTDVDFSGANLSFAYLGESQLNGVVSGGTIPSGEEGPTLPNPWRLTNGYLIGPAANLSGADLSGVQPSFWDHQGLQGANLNGADLSGADLSGADLSIFNPTGTPRAVELRGADLSGADLSDTDLTGADLTGANLSGADLSGANLSGTIWNTPDPAIAELEAQLAEVTAERDAAIAERDTLQDDKTALAGQVTTLIETVAARDASILTLEGEKTALAAQVTTLTETVAARDASIVTLEGERDSVIAERDAVVGDIQLVYDDVAAAAGTTAGDLAPVDSDGTTFDLVWTNTEDPSDTIAMTMEFAEGSITNSPEIPFNTRVPGSVLTIDYQGSVTTHNEPRIAFQSPWELDFSEELIGQAGFGTSPGAPGYGDFNVFGIAVDEGIFNGQNFFTVQAPNESLYTLTSMKIASRFSFLELDPLSEIYFDLAEANQSALAERDAAITERDARPTAEQLAAVEAERDARFTEDQIHAMSADYTIGLNEAGNVQIKISFIESADLHTFTQFTVDPDSLSVVDGKICMEFTPSDDAAFFFRFRIE